MTLIAMGFPTDAQSQLRQVSLGRQEGRRGGGEGRGEEGRRRGEGGVNPLLPCLSSLSISTSAFSALYTLYTRLPPPFVLSPFPFFFTLSSPSLDLTSFTSGVSRIAVVLSLRSCSYVCKALSSSLFSVHLSGALVLLARRKERRERTAFGFRSLPHTRYSAKPHSRSLYLRPP
jgi:hypothetical protein